MCFLELILSRFKLAISLALPLIGLQGSPTVNTNSRNTE